MRQSRPIRKTFPINAMLEGRRVVVVGGGRVGQRKVELLLDAGAEVTLVCPACVEELTTLACAGRIRHACRPFQDADVAAHALVFACTDDKHVNRHILEVAQAARVPCCCADGNWADGDFVTPAILRTGDVMIAVSTSGKSCRQSRLIKDNLRKHLDSIESSDLLVLGTSHEHLCAEERAPYHLAARERELLGGMIRQIWGVHEFFILNTCNRIEIVAAVSQEASTCGILRRLLRLDQLRPDLYYMKHGFDAFAHLCLVTAGMDSQTPGESHVVSQMKEAVDEAVTFGWAGSIIRELADAALHVSKDIHQEIDPLMDIAEIEEVALRYLDHTLPGLPQRRVLVIGSGTVGQGLVSGLLALGCACDWAYFRTAPELSEEGARRVRVVQLDRLNEVLPEVDAIISAVDAREPVITVAAHAAQLRTDGVVMVDLGMPRNIDPAFDRCGGPIRLADLDALKHWYRSATGTLDKILESCRAILAEHRDIYERMRRSIQGGEANGH
ncbi:MAG: NAD(P)-dependent oxidoreductase [Kiritimatiellae bacterium]|nr:NAD(P)-dependent oxidoreductase [Kiritimatiellia bacterium]